MEKLILHVDYDFGQIVYLIHRPELVKGIVTGYLIRPGYITYWITWTNDLSEREHQAMELTSEYVQEFDTNEQS